MHKNKLNMKKILKIKRALLRKILNILGVCTMGLLASCLKYGDYISNFNVHLKGVVKSKDSLKPIKDIQVDVLNDHAGLSTFTDSVGRFSIDARIEENTDMVNLQFSDVDGDSNGSFVDKDTVLNLNIIDESNIEIQLKKDE